jgi:dTMP kinase
MQHSFPLIGICGLEGASKSTSLQTVQKEFESAGQALLSTREPGGTPVAEKIRSIHKEITEEKISPLTELLLMFASREQSYQNVLVPELANQTVITDRLWACSYAYQVATISDNDPKKQVMRETFDMLVKAINETASHQAILLLDVEPEIGIARARGRGELDRIELRDMEFFHKARAGYLELYKRYPDVFFRVDANREMGEVQHDVGLWAKSIIKKPSQIKKVVDSLSLSL